MKVKGEVMDMHKKWSIFVMVSLLVLSVSVNKVQAKSASKIFLHYTDDATKKAVKGVTFTLNKVAGEGKSGYVFTKAYQKNNVTLSSDDTLKNIQIAKQFEKVSKKGIKRTTNKQGKITFNNLKAGVYLIRQTKAAGSAKNYQKIEPFLVYLTESTKKVTYDLTAITPVTMTVFG